MNDQISLLDWMWLTVIAFVLVPIGGMLAALMALDLTRSVGVHVATAAVVPVAVVHLVARRFGASRGTAVRLGLLAALCAMVLLDLGWSGS